MNVPEPRERRCLILGCSRRKIATLTLVPAIERYDGPSFRVLRRFLREAPETARNVDVFVLSAKYGLIDGNRKIGIYDEVMTPSLAKELSEQVKEQIRDLIVPHYYRSVFLSMGKTYLQTVDSLDKLLDQGSTVVTSPGGSGRKLTDLRNWLWGKTVESTSSTDEDIVVQISLFPQTVVLRGRQLKLTTRQAKSLLTEAIRKDPKSAADIRDWYAEISGEKVSPKWAAKQLFGLSASEFSADEARRALRKLGLSCHRL